jgi:hypothetical protein
MYDVVTFMPKVQNFGGQKQPWPFEHFNYLTAEKISFKP